MSDGLRWATLVSLIGALPQDSYWKSLARTALLDEFHKVCQNLTLDSVLLSSGPENLDEWW